MRQFWKSIEHALGLHQAAQDLNMIQIALRAVIMFFAILLILRFSHKRFLARRNALDTLLGFVLASMLARAINGSERLFESIVAGFIIVILHRMLSWVSCRVPAFGRLMKGVPSILVSEGNIQHENLLKHDLSVDDLKEDLRLGSSTDTFESVGKAQLERNGEISVIPKKKTS